MHTGDRQSITAACSSKGCDHLANPIHLHDFLPIFLTHIPITHHHHYQTCVQYHIISLERLLRDSEYVSEMLDSGFSSGGAPMPKITPSDLEKRARPLRNQIFENYTTLREIVARHETTIHKRWLKDIRTTTQDPTAGLASRQDEYYSSS
jgi:hypothetical protein